MAFELGRWVREAAGVLGVRLLRWSAAAAEPASPGVAAEPRAGGTAGPNRALGPRTQAAVAAMAEVLARSGYREVRADLADGAAPELVRGTVRSHRPLLSARGGGRPVLVDVFDPMECDPEEQLSRWHLFSSAAEQLGGEFHVVVPAWLEGTSGRAWSRRVAEACGLRIAHVWEL